MESVYESEKVMATLGIITLCFTSSNAVLIWLDENFSEGCFWNRDKFTDYSQRPAARKKNFSLGFNIATLPNEPA